MANLYLTDPSGKPVVLPAEGNDLQSLVNRGFKGRQATPEENSAAEMENHPFKSAAEGFIHELAFGFADPWVKGMNSGATTPDEVIRQMRASKETNAYTTGQVGGFAASMLIPVGGELKAGATLGKAGLKAMARGGAEGLGMGLGQLVSEQTLENQPLTWEHAGKTLVASTLTGGVLGGVVHKVAGLTSAGARKIDTEAIDRMGDKLGRDAVRHQFGNLSDEAIDLMRESGITGHNFGSTPEQVALHAAGVREKIKADTGNIIPLMDQISPPKQAVAVELAMRLRKAAKETDDATLGPRIAEMFAGERVEGEVVQKLPSWSDLANVDREISAAKPSLSHFTDIVKAALKQAPKDSPLEGALAVGLQKYTVADELFQAAGKTAKDLAASKSGDVNLGMIGAVMGHPIAALGEVIMKRVGSARWSTAVDNAISGAVRPSLLKRAADGIRKGLNGMSTVAASSPFRIALEHASIRGDAALLAEHAAIVNSADGAEYMQQMGLMPEAPGDGSAKAGTINAIASFTDAQGKMNDSHIESFFGGAKGKAIKPGSLNDFNATMANVNQVLLNPQALYETLPPSLMGGAPAIAGQATATALKAYQMLSDVAPKDPGAGLPPALRRPWEPSSADLAKWFRTLEAIKEPATAVAQAGSGRVSPEAVKVLKNIYPAMYSDLQQKVLERLSKGKLTAAQRAGLQQLFGGPGQSNQQLQVIQMSHKNSAGASMQGGQGAKPDGRQDVDAQKNMETQGQRLERR